MDTDKNLYFRFIQQQSNLNIMRYEKTAICDIVVGYTSFFLKDDSYLHPNSNFETGF